MRESKRNTRHLKNPLSVIDRDQNKVTKEIDKHEKAIEAINKTISLYKNVLNDIDKAKSYLKVLPKNLFEELYNLSKWRNHKELYYVFDIPAIY